MTTVAEALHRHAMRETRHIDLSIEDGVVALSGTVGSWSERRARRGVSAPGGDARHDARKTQRLNRRREAS